MLSNYCTSQQTGNTVINIGGNTHQTEISSSPNNEKTDKAIDNQFSASIYPNPFNDFTTLNLSGDYEQNIQLQIIDITGRTIKTIETNKRKKF